MTQYAVVDPATGETVKEYPTATDAEVMDAVAQAHTTYQEWARGASVAERAALVGRVGELHTERRQQLAEIIVREMGKPLEDALGEVDFSAAIYGYYAEHAERFLADEPIDLLDGEGSAVIQRRPVGVLLGIMPWNFPDYQVARFAAPNLAAGNTIVLKHAPQCPETAEALQQIFLDAGFPAGAYVNVYATNEQIADVIADPRVQGVSLTGSERAGAAVAEIAGRNLKKVVLELGGSDPFIVLSTDDLDATVDAAVAARLDNTGQACNAGKRIIVHERIYDDFVSRFTEKILQSSAAPLSSEAAAERLETQVSQAVSDGASLATAGERDGTRFPPGVLTGVRPGRRHLPRGAVRARSRWCSRPRRGRRRAHRQRHALRLGLVRVHQRRRAGAPGRRADRGRHGVRQRRRRRGCRAAVRRRQALRLRPRARPLRHRGVRQPQAGARRPLTHRPGRVLDDHVNKVPEHFTRRPRRVKCSGTYFT